MSPNLSFCLYQPVKLHCMWLLDCGLMLQTTQWQLVTQKHDDDERKTNILLMLFQ